jgi:hypothetical protein
MSNLDFTPNGIKTVIDEAEQMSLVVMMLLEQKLPDENLRQLLVPLLEKLNSDLQDASVLIMLHSQEGGMGDAPMRGALELSSC